MPPPVPPTTDDVIAERARRLAAGFDCDLGARGVHRISTTDADMRGWDEVTALASAYIARGDDGAEIAIVTDTSPVAVTALEWQDILVAAGVFRQPIWAASFTLQAMTPILTTSGGRDPDQWGRGFRSTEVVSRNPRSATA